MEVPIKDGYTMKELIEQYQVDYAVKNKSVDIVGRFVLSVNIVVKV